MINKTIISTYRNPKINFSVNPQENYNINPKYNARINPQKNYSINPLKNSAINPECNYSINPLKNSNINPEHNYSVSPLYNDNINPLKNNSINPKFNKNFKGFYRFNLSNECIGFTIINGDFIWVYDDKMKSQSYGIKRETGYSIFNFNASYIGYIDSDGDKGYNVFDTSNEWIGHLK